MADNPISSIAGSLGSTGANVILPLLSDFFVTAYRDHGTPLRAMTDVSNTVASYGDTARVWVAPDSTSNLLTDGSAVTKNDAPGTAALVVLNRHRETTFSLTQVGAALAGNSIAQKLIASRMIWLMNGVEEDVLGIATSFTTNAAAGTFNTSLTEAACVTAVFRLANQRAPGPYMGIVDDKTSTSWAALVQIANFVQAQGQSNPWLTVKPSWGSGYFWNNTYWFPTSSVVASGTSTSNIVFSPAAIAVAMRPLPMPLSGNVRAINTVDVESGIAFQIVMSYNGDTLADQITVHTLYGSAITKNAYGIELRS